MKTRLSLTCIAALLVFSAPAEACENCRLGELGYHVGEMTLLGNGVVFSWAQVDKEGKPAAIGITFTETALSGLREDPPESYPRSPGWEYFLRLPAEASAKSPFDHVAIDWNPKGHLPPGIYDTPHFDVHFYMLPYEERIKITAEGESLERCRKFPDEQYLPSSYFFAPGSEEPKMGSHFLDKETPELNGKPFTHTFIFGTYDGKVIFWEPMIAKDFLETRPDATYAIKVPQAVQVTGFYPSSYTIKFNPGRKEYTVALTDFVWKEAS